MTSSHEMFSKPKESTNEVLKNTSNALKSKSIPSKSDTPKAQNFTNSQTTALKTPLQRHDKKEILIEKRDGRKVKFEQEKIIEAMKSAYRAYAVANLCGGANLANLNENSAHLSENSNSLNSNEKSASSSNLSKNSVSPSNLNSNLSENSINLSKNSANSLNLNLNLSENSTNSVNLNSNLGENSANSNLTNAQKNGINSTKMADFNEALIPDDFLAFAENVAQKIQALCENELLNVEQIQDRVENALMSSGYKDVARKYIIYRDKRTTCRERNSRLIKATISRNGALNVLNANANVDERSFSGREKEALGDVQKYLAFELGGVSSEMAKAHKEMRIYQHDAEKSLLGVHNCAFVDFKHIFENGFITRNGGVRPPKSFSTACQLVAVVFQCQSQVQFGGVGSAHIDTDLAPFVKMSFKKHYIIAIAKASDDFDALKLDEMTDDEISEWVDTNKAKYLKSANLKESDIFIDNKANLNKHFYNAAYFDLLREGKQSSQGLYHNLNTLESRQGSQVPFTSINFGRDTSTEGRLVSKWMLNASLNGIGKFHQTSIFPISIFQYKKGTNSHANNANYDLKQLALKSLSKRIYPNFANGDWSQAHEDINDPDTFFSTMGCRTLMGYDRHGLGYKRVGRGNNVPNTIILPKLGIEYGICLGERAEPDLDGFWSAFEETLLLSEKTLLERYAIMIKQTPNAAPFMYQNGTMSGKGGSVEETLKHNTLAIGYIGIAEMCQALFGKNHIHSIEAYDFALRVVKRINEFAKQASERNNLNFTCYATPAEGLCRTALRYLRDEYGTIKGVTDREYITNSHHTPVWENVGIYEKLTLESPFCKYPTGGCITYIELESTFMNNTKAIEDVIDYAFDELDIPYLAFNFPIDSCLECGFQGEFNESCPECESTQIQQLRRVTGYLTTDYKNFNAGKLAETNERVKHSAFENFSENADFLGENDKTSIKRVIEHIKSTYLAK